MTTSKSELKRLARLDPVAMAERIFKAELDLKTAGKVVEAARLAGCICGMSPDQQFHTARCELLRRAVAAASGEGV